MISLCLCTHKQFTKVRRQNLRSIFISFFVENSTYFVHAVFAYEMWRSLEPNLVKIKKLSSVFSQHTRVLFCSCLLHYYCYYYYYNRMVWYANVTNCIQLYNSHFVARSHKRYCRICIRVSMHTFVLPVANKLKKLHFFSNCMHLNVYYILVILCV